MQRLHEHEGADGLAQSIRFYSTPLATEPTVVKEDYAKWMLEDPRVNFAISPVAAVRSMWSPRLSKREKSVR